MASQYSLSGRIWSNLISNRSTLVLPKIPHYIERAQQNVYTRGGYASHTGWLSYKSYNPAENIRKQLRTSKNTFGTSDIILRTTLVQFEQDFNTRTKMWDWWMEWRGSQTRPIPRSPDGDKNVFFPALPEFPLTPLHPNNLVNLYNFFTEHCSVSQFQI